MMANHLNAILIFDRAIPVVENKTGRFPTRLEVDRARHVTIVIPRQCHHLATLSQPSQKGRRGGTRCLVMHQIPDHNQLPGPILLEQLSQAILD